MAKVLVETSARHVHVTEETLKVLFGEGATLTKKKDLSQPGQFACEERVTVVGPKKSLERVSILGPVRKADQVELSLTDARSIGVDAPVRESGDVAGSGACKLVGPCGEIEIADGKKLTFCGRDDLQPEAGQYEGCQIYLGLAKGDSPEREAVYIPMGKLIVE